MHVYRVGKGQEKSSLVGSKVVRPSGVRPAWGGVFLKISVLSWMLRSVRPVASEFRSLASRVIYVVASSSDPSWPRLGKVRLPPLSFSAVNVSKLRPGAILAFLPCQQSAVRACLARSSTRAMAVGTLAVGLEGSTSLGCIRPGRRGEIGEECCTVQHEVSSTLEIGEPGREHSLVCIHTSKWRWEGSREREREREEGGVGI